MPEEAVDDCVEAAAAVLLQSERGFWTLSEASISVFLLLVRIPSVWALLLKDWHDTTVDRSGESLRQGIGVSWLAGLIPAKLSTRILNCLNGLWFLFRPYFFTSLLQGFYFTRRRCLHVLTFGCDS
ncbi:hypothetical protein RchiOBHm_Chr1g0329641 [Rosa chinensis]|uniref:Uncharacterized protein n=1 Tax=Rosa chinensis TaxID=74649 RepID=A0A2P6SB54_ROSCH|nr:hypothetical protein RchiOBHm_Chr1g0329641 [Rosa chinensis]